MQGTIAFQRFEQTKSNADLKEASGLYTLAMAYSTQPGEVYANLRRARRFIYRNMGQLNPAELKVVAESVKEVEKDHFDDQKSDMYSLLDDRGLWYGQEEN